MNPRIRELAEQAGWTEGYYESDDGPFIEPEFNKEKFAELIVRECMKVTKDYTCNQGWDYSAPVALARHFGVGQ
jgi:hypothetical protein